MESGQQEKPSIDVARMQDAVLSSSTNRRGPWLASLRQHIVDSDLPQKDIDDVIDTLFKTYPYYNDRNSRRAVQACLGAFLANGYQSTATPTIIDEYRREASRPGIAPSNAFVLIELGSVILRASWEHMGKLAIPFATVLDVCLSSGKSTVKQTALVIARRTVRVYCENEARITALVEQLTSKGQSLGLRTAGLLGVIAGVCARKNQSALLRNTQVYYAFLRDVVGSRVPVPSHIVPALADFLHNFVSIYSFQSELLPSLEKALLRAPEVALGVMPILLQSLHSDGDLSTILADNLLKPLLSNVKSQNPVVRDRVLTNFATLIRRSKDSRKLQVIQEELSLSISKATATDHRLIYAQLLELLPITGSNPSSISLALVQTASKEPNEAALNAEMNALSSQMSKLLLGSTLDASTLNAAIHAFNKGLSDKKQTSKKMWVMGFSEILWQLRNQSSIPGRADGLNGAALSRFAGELATKLYQIFDEITQNPYTAGAFTTAALVVTAIHPQMTALIDNEAAKHTARKAKVIERTLETMYHSRIMTKFSGAKELQWLVRSLVACSDHIIKSDISKDMKDAWARAFIYTTSGINVPHHIRSEAAGALTQVYIRQKTVISRIIIDGLWVWYRSLSVVDTGKDTIGVKPNTSVSHASLIVYAISPSPEGTDPEILKSQLIDMLVLCRPEILPQVAWIEICLRLGQDPGHLAQEKAEQCLSKIDECLASNEAGTSSDWIDLAAYNAAAELAFVAPSAFIPLLSDQIGSLLPAEQIKLYGPIDIAIARTPEGVAFIDVLSTKAQTLSVEKNSPDYDIMKWEEEMRSQIAQKKGQEKRLTADERAKVNAQLAKEANIRNEINKLERMLRHGVGFIHALAIGPPTEAILWLGSSIEALIKIIEAGASRLIGNAADEAYLACSKYMASRLDITRTFVGIATLRALGTSSISTNLLEEPLGDLVTRILYRLHSASEQRPFDVLSLIYMLPLIFAVLRKNGIGQSEPDAADEQVTLALEILSYHSDLFSHPSLPREELVVLLIESMQSYSQHYRLIKDCILDASRAMSENISTMEVARLLQGSIVSQSSIRAAVLQAIRENIDLTDKDFSEEVWLACHDSIEQNAEIAHLIWQENALEVLPEHASTLIPYLASSDRQLRFATSRALAEGIGDDASVFDQVLGELKSQYIVLAKPRVPERDAYGMVKKTDLADPWQNRSGIAMAFKAMASQFQESKLVPFADFLIQDKALGDRNATVRDEMIDAATTIMTLHGGTKLEALMQNFEAALDNSEAVSDASDLVNEAVVILYGALAGHLQAGDNRVSKVITRLLQTLETPSETVQYAVAGCLPPLIHTLGEKTSDYVQLVLDQLLKSKKYASRRGAAYGLAGIVKGKGVVSLRENRIMSTLKSAIENKKDQNHRQGALFAYELMALILGRTFEPYIIQIVPQLLASFGDSTADVREACLDASKTCFASLSSYGVKIILPILLEGLEESQWRSKKGACDSLGAMAYLDPQQLALSLPDIIPPLTGVLNDSHKEVRTSANRSLQRFGEVISNPEIKSLVSILLKALSDPTKYTDEALDALIKVSFVHYLDSPSLALIVRILERALGERSASKRKSAQIIGSLAHLTERKDVTPHLPILVTGLKLAIVDPVPATRATASKALGSLVEKLGEDALPDLIPSLMSTLKSDTGAGDRLGSAQALSEVLAGLGTGRLEETLPTVLQNVASSKPTVREGFMSLFIYLPACFGNSFANYLSKIIPPILSGLADDVESIRDTSLRAGRLLVKNFATKAIDLLLPELDRGLADDSYRIRLSSVELVGDLLFNLIGISGKTEQDEEEEGAAEAGQSLLDVLGEEKRNKILSSLYICRNDTSGLVRSAAINVWKALVSTPRTLKELVPTLTQLLIRRLASPNMEQRVIASNALGELIRKAGDGVLASLLPTLQEGLQTSTDADNRQGICIALKEIISSASPEVLEDYEKTLISVVRIALVDADGEVREAAAEAFDSLQKILGKKAVDQVLPHLLNLLRSSDGADTALSALLTLLTDNTRSNIILPNLVPTLLVSPFSSFNAKAIASLSEVAGPAMTRRLPNILNALMDNIVSCKDDNLRSELEDSFDAILLSMDEFDGLNTAMSVLLAMVKNDDHRRRAATNIRLANFFTKTSIDFARYHQDLIRVLLISFDDADSEVVKAAWLALSELTKRLKKEEMESLVLSTRQILQQVGVAGANLPGFSLPKGINAILPIFLQGLMNGTADQRTNAALAISDIIDRTSSDSLKPFVTQITGPLIRVVSERSTDVKCAILLTLNNLLGKVPIFLKPFLPQLQRTFSKSLADPSSEILRNRAARALGTLITMTPRIDPLVAELVTGSKTSDSGVQNAMLKALYEVVSKAGANMSEGSRNLILGLIDGESGTVDASLINTHARLLGGLIKSLPSSFDASGLIKTRVLTQRMTNASVLSLNAVLVDTPTTLTGKYSQETPTIICHGIRSKNTFISENSILAAGKYLLLSERPSSAESNKKIVEDLAIAAKPGGPVDTRRLALVVIRTVVRTDDALVQSNLPNLALPIFESVRDPVIPIKLAAEAAFLAIFSVVDREAEVFDEYILNEGSALVPSVKRSMQDYFRRVALRLGTQARERREAEGGQGGLGLSNDEREDEREIWSVGKVDLGDNTFNEE